MENKPYILLLCILSVVFMPFKVFADSVNVYRESLENCWQLWDTTHATSDDEIIEVIDSAEKCVQEIGYSIIDRFYAKNKIQMRENFDDFVRIVKNLEQDAYTKSDFRINNTVSIKDVTARSSSLYLLRKMVEDMIAAVQWDLDDKQKIYAIDGVLKVAMYDGKHIF